MKKPTPFGKAARMWRLEHDMKLKDMASMMGVSSAFLSAIELGHKGISPEHPRASLLPKELQVWLYEDAALRCEERAKAYRERAKSV